MPMLRTKKKVTLDDIQLLLLSLPTTIWYLLFCYVPMFGIMIAFKNYKVAAGKGFMYSLFVKSKWCGFDNFKFLFAGQKATTIRPWPTCGSSTSTSCRPVPLIPRL